MRRDAMESALRRGDLSTIGEALRGPKADATLGQLRELWKERPTLRNAITDVLLRAPERWTHVDAFELTKHNAGLPRERAIVDAQLSLASGKNPPAWAVHRSVELAVRGDPLALSGVRELAASGRSDVKALIRSVATSSDARPELAAQLMLETRQALPLRLRETLSQSLSRSGPSRELLTALTQRAAQGDEGAIDVLLAAKSNDGWLKAARRDAFDSATSPAVKERLAEAVASAGPSSTPADIRRLMEAISSGSRSGLSELAQAIDFLPPNEGALQAEAAKVLEQAALSGRRDAAEALLSLPVDFSTAPGVISSMAAVAAQSGKPADAALVLNALELPLKYRVGESHDAAVEAFRALAPHAETRHFAALAQGLGSESIRSIAGGGPTPSAAVLADALAALPADRRSAALPALAPLRADAMGRLVDALGDRASVAELTQLRTAVLEEAAAAPPYSSLLSSPAKVGVSALLRQAASDTVPDLTVFTLTSPAIFNRLSDAEQRQVGELAARGSNAAKSAVLSVTEPTEGLPELGARARQYQTALITALRGATPGTPLGNLALTLNSISMAQTPEHQGRVNLEAAYRKIDQLLADPSVQRSLETLRSAVTQPGDERVLDRLVRSLSSGAGRARLASLPPEQASSELLGAYEMLRNVSPSHAEQVRQLAAQHVLSTAKAGLQQLPTEAREAALARLGLSGIDAKELATETLGLAEKLIGVIAKDSNLAKVLKISDTALAVAQATVSGDPRELVDSAVKVGELAVAGLETGAALAGFARTARVLGVVGGGLGFYDAASNAFDGIDDWKNNGDVAGGISKLVSGAGAAALALSAIGTGGWSLIIIGGAALIGGKIGDATLGESEQLARLRQLGLYQ